MIHIYYHIYATDGITSMIDEQISLIYNTFKFDFKLTIGVSVKHRYSGINNILSDIRLANSIRDIKVNSDEFVTLDLLEKDKQTFGDSDYILYFHTKGASRQNHIEYNPNIISWRNIMNYFNIERYEDAFKIFENGEFNTYGILLSNDFYRGNFWWATSDYIKSIDISKYERRDRYDAEGNYIRFGKDWKPYCAYNIDSSIENLYNINFKKETYIK